MEASSLPRRGGPLLARSPRLLAALGDDQLVAQVRRGNETAFEVVYDRHHRGLLSFCRHMLGSREEAEDAVQQAFASGYRALTEDDRPVKLKPWLYTIARNRCLSILRARRETASEDIEISTAGLAEEVQQRDDLRELLRDLTDLPEQQRAALVLSEVGDLAHSEVANVIGCETAKVKSLVFQARTGLAERREARETPCAEIREQLATLRGGALRRGPLRRHLKVCPACAEFREDVRRQRAMMAVILPVVPSLGLKESALAATGASSLGAGGGALAGGVTAAGVGATGAGVSGGLIGAGGGAGGSVVGSASAAGGGLLSGLVAKAGVPKLVALAVLAGGATVGGGAAINDAGSSPDPNSPGTDSAVAAPQDEGDAGERTSVRGRLEKRSGAGGQSDKRSDSPAADGDTASDTQDSKPGDDKRSGNRGSVGADKPQRGREWAKTRGKGKKHGLHKPHRGRRDEQSRGPKPKPNPKPNVKTAPKLKPPKSKPVPPGQVKKHDGDDDDDEDD